MIGSMHLFRFISCLIVILFMSSCKKLVEVDNPRTQLLRGVVFESDATANAAVLGLYSGLTSQSGTLSSIGYLAALSADELKIEQGNETLPFYQNELAAFNTSVASLWQSSYNGIYLANSIIEGLELSEGLTPAIKNQLTGEAKFFRAFRHFYLVNLFGDVAYITTTDYSKNGLLKRMPVMEVYEKIITDLTEAKDLLSIDYNLFNGERVRVNKWAATALLARVYLYREEWEKAELFASEVISRSALYSLTSLNSVFFKSSSETIWQLIPPATQKHTNEGGVFNRQTYSADIGRLTEGLYNAFEPGDERKTNWTLMRTSGGQTWYSPSKYKENNNNATGAEYSSVLRLAELYLIRAEARARQGNLTGAASDINVIRNRAGLTPITVLPGPDILMAIEQERRVELFTEWGHRWLDLKRTNRASSVLNAIKPGWQPTDVLYPIPYSELQLNPNLTQNAGY